jgi:hypothetical protein
MTKYSTEIVEEICEHIKEGLPQKYAAALCGISETTFYEWLDPKSNKFKEEFAESVRKAHAIHLKSLVDDLKLHHEKPSGVGAITFQMERRYAGDYGNKQKIEHDIGPTTLAAMIAEKEKENS